MRKKKLSSLVSAVAAALALQFSAAAGAAVLYSNGGVEASPGGGSGMNEYNQAADFTLGGASNLTGITFFNLESAAADYAGSIFWRIVGNLGGAPDDGNVIGSGTASPTRTGLGAGPLGLNVVQNDFAISVLGLAAGTYWLELHNGPLGSTGFTDFYWAMSNSSGGNDRDYDLIGGGPWLSNSSEHAFNVLGERVTTPPPVPVPGTIVLTLAGMGLLAARRRRGA